MPDSAAGSGSIQQGESGPSSARTPEATGIETPMGVGRVLAELGWGVLPVLVLAIGTAWIHGQAWLWIVGLSVALYAFQGGLLLSSAPTGPSGRGLGPANRVTLLRSTLVVPIAALLPWWSEMGAGATWWVIALASLTLILDGVDGRVARATKSRTALGARFDMELDAVLILVLSVGVWLGGRAGAWVLLVGLFRYVFVVAGLVWTRLQAPLPESRRRKVVCVIQGVALLVALGPIIPPGIAVAAAAAALVSLIYSFGVDTIWLLRNGGGA